MEERFLCRLLPERINPGDKERTIEKIIKVVSGDTKETLSAISNLYASIISAGVYEANHKSSGGCQGN